MELEPFELCWDDGGTTWCMLCVTSGDFNLDMSPATVKRWKKKSYKLQLEHYRKQVKDLEKALKDLEKPSK